MSNVGSTYLRVAFEESREYKQDCHKLMRILKEKQWLEGKPTFNVLFFLDELETPLPNKLYQIVHVQTITTAKVIRVVHPAVTRSLCASTRFSCQGYLVHQSRVSKLLILDNVACIAFQIARSCKVPAKGAQPSRHSRRRYVVRRGNCQRTRRLTAVTSRGLTSSWLRHSVAF